MATARHLYCSLSKGSEIRLPSFYPRAVLPVAQAGCISAGATPFPFLSSANTLTGPMSHTVISLSNDYSAIPLLLSPENVFSFFFFFQHGYTESFTSIQVLVSFCSPMLYFLYWHFILNQGETKSCLQCCDQKFPQVISNITYKFYLPQNAGTPLRRSSLHFYNQDCLSSHSMHLISES